MTTIPLEYIEHTIAIIVAYPIYRLIPIVVSLYCHLCGYDAKVSQQQKNLKNDCSISIMRRSLVRHSKLVKLPSRGLIRMDVIAKAED